MGAQNRLAVLGSPISHSLSPAIHRAAHRVLGLDWQYEAIECEEPELERLLESRDDAWLGFSVTMPLKSEAHRLSRVLDPVAQESGVVNTLLRLAGSEGWAGFNTDVAGLADAIDEAGLDATSTVVIGSGATAVSAILAARRLGAQRVQVVARNQAAVAELVQRFNDTSEPQGAPIRVTGATPAELDHATATLLISTLPGPASAELVLPDGAHSVPLFDVAYDPWPSPLAERWRNAGGVAHAGLRMLVFQAVYQERIFIGGDPTRPLQNEDDVVAAIKESVN